MALWNERDFSPEGLQGPMEGEDNPLRTLHAFHDAYVLNAPERSPAESPEIFTYDRLVFFGTFQPVGSGVPSLFAIRGASAISKDYLDTAGRTPDKFRFFVCTTDGVRTDEWCVDHASWRRSRAPEGELIMRITRPLPSGKGTEGGELRLSYQGGVIRLPGQSEESWLVGQEGFVEGPKFVVDPARTYQSIYNGNNDTGYNFRLLRRLGRQ
jgi:hypothetical protein